LPQVVLETTIGKAAAPDQKAIQPTPLTRLKTEYRTLAESLKEAGYATGHFGKWHLGPEPYSPLQQGFDVDVPHHPGPGPAGSFVAPWKFANITERVPGEHIEDRMAVEAVNWMEKNRDRPFYLNYWMFSVHAPFDAKKTLIDKYRSQVNPADPQRSPTYAAMIESMDDAIGTLLDALDRLQLADNTIILFTSDNGGNMYNEVDGTTPTSNAPLRGGKATMFEGGTRVPCVIAWPGVTVAGSRSDAVIQSEDYYPTLLDGLGLSAASDQRFDGISVLAALQGAELARDAVFQYFPHNPGVPDWLPPSVSVHCGDWKLIRIFHGGENGAHRYLLFNLREDLGEKNNVASQKPELVSELDARITDFLTDTQAVVPIPNPAFDPAKYRPELEGQPRLREKPQAKPRAQPAVKDDGDPALQGWKARNCTATVKNGVLRVGNVTDASFLGFAAGKHSGASTVRLRVKAGGGVSHFDWLPGGVQDQAHSVPFTLGGGDWQEIAIEVPATGPLGIVRIYLPKQAQPAETDWIEIDWIEITSKTGKPTRTEF
jgi:arylsulfatase A-like enzyme